MIAARIDSVATYAQSQPDALALADLESGRRWTYGALDRAADGVAAWLCARLGPASGERVAVLARNCAETMLLHLGATRAGAMFVPLNWRLSPVEGSMTGRVLPPVESTHSPLMNNWGLRASALLAASE